MQILIGIMAGAFLVIILSVMTAAIFGTLDFTNPLHWIVLACDVGISIQPVVWATRYRGP